MTGNHQRGFKDRAGSFYLVFNPSPKGLLNTRFGGSRPYRDKPVGSPHGGGFVTLPPPCGDAPSPLFWEYAGVPREPPNPGGPKSSEKTTPARENDTRKALIV